MGGLLGVGDTAAAAAAAALMEGGGWDEMHSGPRGVPILQVVVVLLLLWGVVGCGDGEGLGGGFVCWLLLLSLQCRWQLHPHCMWWGPHHHWSDPTLGWEAIDMVVVVDGVGVRGVKVGSGGGCSGGGSGGCVVQDCQLLSQQIPTLLCRGHHCRGFHPHCPHPRGVATQWGVLGLEGRDELCCGDTPLLWF